MERTVSRSRLGSGGEEGDVCEDLHCARLVVYGGCDEERRVVETMRNHQRSSSTAFYTRNSSEKRW